MPGARFTFDAIGTKWDIEIFDNLEDEKAGDIQASVRTRIDSFDKNYSRFRDDSLVMTMSREPGRYTLPDDAQPLMDMYRQLYDLTSGKVTPLIGRTMESAGYDASYSLNAGTLVTPPEWDAALEYDFPHLLIKQPVVLDFGAAGKGYLTDIISELLQSRHIHKYCINAGGDIVYRSNTTEVLKIGLEHPADPLMAIGVAKIHNQSLCGSAGNRRTWGDYHHIINPVSLQSPRHIAALWVTADTGLLADGLATALFFTSPAILKSRFNFEYAIIRSNYALEHSPHFPADFFTNANNEKIQ